MHKKFGFNSPQGAGRMRSFVPMYYLAPLCSENFTAGKAFVDKITNHESPGNFIMVAIC